MLNENRLVGAADWDVMDVDIALRLPRESAPTHGYEPTREAAMAAFAKSWRRES
jgi:hypothetical protein